MQTKICPDCGESVAIGARKCRYCQHGFGMNVPLLLQTNGWIGAIILLALGSLVTLVTPRIWAAITDPLTRTELVYMHPADSGTINRDLHVKDYFTAKSCVESLETREIGVLRCFVAESNDIQDPCWPIMGERYEAVCLLTPWDTDVTVVDISKDIEEDALRQKPPPSTVPPWAIELEHHQRCVHASGAVGTVAGMGTGTTFVCGKAGYVVGDVNSASKVWTALFVKYGSSEITRENIRRVWE